MTLSSTKICENFSGYLRALVKVVLCLVALLACSETPAAPSAKQPIGVMAVASSPPVVRATLACDPDNLKCTFYGGTSTDDVKITSFSWSLGDGISFSSPTHPNVTHTYRRAGLYNVVLRVADADGQSDSLVRLVNVGPVDAPPVARFSVTCAALKCTFWGKYSTDDRGIVRYSWDLGDGVFYSDSVHPNVTHTYKRATTVAVRLIVTDAAAQADTALHEVALDAPNSSTLGSANFDDGTLGPFYNPWGDATIDTPLDPTASGHGRVARIHYKGSNGDNNRALGFAPAAARTGLGQTMFFKAELYLPPGLDLSGGSGIQRKLLYWQRYQNFSKYPLGGGPDFSSIVKLTANSLEWVGGTGTPTGAGVNEILSRGIATLTTGRWYTLEEQLTMNSTPAATDGVVRIWLDKILIFEKTDLRFTHPDWATNNFGGGAPFDFADFGLQQYLTGDQVNWSGTFDEYRYWDNVSFARARR